MRLNKIALAGLVLGGSVLLAACGGGSGGGSVFGGDPALTLKGTAATGAAINGGAVTATCKTGTGTATSNSEGSFTVTITNGVGPCLLAITPVGSTTPIYSITSGSGATQTANITPMTNMLVNYLLSVPGMTAANPAAWFALPAVKTLLADTTALTARITNDFIPAVQLLLPTLSLSNPDFLFTAFTANPANSSTDADLEKLKAAGIVTSNGAPSTATTNILKNAAANDHPVVPPTGATGAGS
ncbi:MAG: hypothetical protein ABIR56_00350 [Polaromonas sp.]